MPKLLLYTWNVPSLISLNWAIDLIKYCHFFLPLSLHFRISSYDSLPHSLLFYSFFSRRSRLQHSLNRSVVLPAFLPWSPFRGFQNSENSHREPFVRVIGSGTATFKKVSSSPIESHSQKPIPRAPGMTTSLVGFESLEWRNISLLHLPVDNGPTVPRLVSNAVYARLVPPVDSSWFPFFSNSFLPFVSQSSANSSN